MEGREVLSSFYRAPQFNLVPPSGTLGCHHYEVSHLGLSHSGLSGHNIALIFASGCTLRRKTGKQLITPRVKQGLEAT